MPPSRNHKAFPPKNRGGNGAQTVASVASIRPCDSPADYSGDPGDTPELRALDAVAVLRLDYLRFVVAITKPFYGPHQAAAAHERRIIWRQWMTADEGTPDELAA